MARISALPGTGLLGIATSKKIGGRPERNRARRRFREAVRIQADLAEPRLDFILIVGANGADVPFQRIQEEVRDLFRRAVERWADELESS
ncbi:ribonuclease P protein component [Fimbriimonas ginsengisoli]|uniref:ribonuclease P protein component n=1 Tax=Fimbriimonas ginsengisoli TaxID=1005039 RepID=UPI0004AC626D